MLTDALPTVPLEILQHIQTYRGFEDMLQTKAAGLIHHSQLKLINGSTSVILGPCIFLVQLYAEIVYYQSETEADDLKQETEADDDDDVDMVEEQKGHYEMRLCAKISPMNNIIVNRNCCIQIWRTQKKTSQYNTMMDILNIDLTMI